MTKTLEDRLRDTKNELEKIDVHLSHKSVILRGDADSHFRRITSLSSDVDHWITLIEVRNVARKMMESLEKQADDGTVSFGGVRVRYQLARLLGVQAYLSANWALADSLIPIVGRVHFSQKSGGGSSKPAQLVTHFISRDRLSNHMSAFFEPLRESFGWPIGISYALRNHFIHDGGYETSVDFFEGPTPESGFKISLEGWARTQKTAETQYGVNRHQHRAQDWPAAPCADLRAVLNVCEREMDDALGILVRSASKSLVAHLGCMFGED